MGLEKLEVFVPATASACSTCPLHLQDGKVDWATQGKDAAKTYGDGFKVRQLRSSWLPCEALTLHFLWLSRLFWMQGGANTAPPK